MSCLINAKISSKAAVRLLVMNEIDISYYWQTKQAEALLEELYYTDVSELLRIIDFIDPQTSFDSSTIPQFGSLKTLIRIPETMISKGIDGLSYTQLGFFLKEDIKAKPSANAKYGETHGKGACQLGLAECKKGKIHFGALTNAFNSIHDQNRQLRIAKLLCFRIPVVQTLLNRARDEKVNGFNLISFLEESTQQRRAICIKMILKELKTLENADLSKRIDNIYWNI